MKIIAVDFDGTLCSNEWPEIGAQNHELFNYLQTERENGAKIILNTCREGDLLAKAVAWCMKRGLYFDAVNENLKETIALFGGDCRKISATEYIDDLNSTKFKLPFKETKDED